MITGLILGFILFGLGLIYLTVGISFWRIHRNDLIRLAAYFLTRTEELRLNFWPVSRLPLQRSMALAGQALSWNGVSRLIMLWPLTMRRYVDALQFAHKTSCLIGDEVVVSLVERIRALGFQQADSSLKKSLPHYRDGFLVRRLDPELVAVIWHARVMNVEAVQRKYQALERLLQRWGFYPELISGEAQDGKGRTLPYLVIYEPFCFGAPPSFQAFLRLWKADAAHWLEKLRGGIPEWEEESESTTALSHPTGSPDDKLVDAYTRFIRSTVGYKTGAQYTAPHSS